MTPLQEARKRAADYEIKVKEALAQRAIAEKVKAETEVVRKRVFDKANKVPVTIERPGRIHVTTLAAIKAAYLDNAVVEDLGSRGRKAPARAVELVKAGAIKVQLSSEGTALSLAGLTRRTRYPDKAGLRRIAAAQRKMDAADAAARKARAEWVRTIAEVHEAGDPVPADTLADVAGTLAACEVTWHKANRAIPWEFASDQRISDGRKKVQEHLAAAKEKRECQCYDCIGERNRARWAKGNAA